jgi:DNA invertase Pin-like site-specific DNA recombinase
MAPPVAAIYLRVSKSDGSQSVENQRPEVEQLARGRGFEVAHVYEEQASAAKHRPIFEGMLKDAKRGKFKALIVWSLDRFGRSMTGNLADVLELDRLGVTVISVRESWLDTGSPVRSLLIAIFSWVAEQERARLIERTKAGLQAARRRGAKIGRPRRRVDLDRARELRGEGQSLRAVAKDLGVGYATLCRALTDDAGGAARRGLDDADVKAFWETARWAATILTG